MATLITGKAEFVTWAIIIPLLFDSFAVVAAYFLLTSFTASLALALVFQLSHCVVEAEFVNPADETRERVWQVHQLESTVDFARGNRTPRFASPTT